jgi:hypothetical protein
MNRKPRQTKDATCRELALRACRELLVAAEARPSSPNVNRALVLARYALAMRP